MASSVTSTMAIRMSNWSKERIERASKDGGRKMRGVMEDMAQMLESGELKITPDGLRAIPKNPENKKGASANTEESGRERIPELEARIAEMEKLSAERSQEGKSRWGHIEGTLLDIGQMASLTGGTLEGLLEDLHRRMESGEISVVGGKIGMGTVDVCPFGWQEMAEVCDDAGVDYGVATKKFVQMMLRGMV